MATYNATSKINLEVNGSQANKIFNQLKKEAEQLRKKIDEAALAGDSVPFTGSDFVLTSTQKETGPPSISGSGSKAK